MYSVNNPHIIRIAEDAGIDCIWIDLEINGKELRQKNLNTLISRHSIDDIKVVRSIIKRAELMVRINPMFDGSENEIEKSIEYGADMIMLPFFKTAREVESFLKIVNGRVKTSLLLETPEAVEILDDILDLKGIDEIHIGINDLHLGYKRKFMFELLADGTVESICKKIKMKGIPYGFGGITRLTQGTLPAECVIAEHYRIGSTRAILSRSFFDANEYKHLSDAKELERLRAEFIKGIEDIRRYERSLLNQDNDFFTQNKDNVRNIVEQIIG